MIHKKQENDSAAIEVILDTASNATEVTFLGCSNEDWLEHTWTSWPPDVEVTWEE